LIFQSNRDDELRETAAGLVFSIFNGRRRLGTIDPQVLFVYDEADEFIPGSGREDKSYALSKGAAQTLARRGRKFGLGMAIATQRVAYLDTSIIAQPHTYFISKMPREYDRQAIANAFGTTNEMMTKTLKFSKGQWLLVSFDATGLVNVPLPVQFRNANQRIVEHLNLKGD
jgi:DNA helicase HerA-like ATPase